MKTTEVLDLETMEFTGYGPAMLAGRGGRAVVADDAGGRVFVLGGLERGIEVLEAAVNRGQFFDIDSKVFKVKRPPPPKKPERSSRRRRCEISRALRRGWWW